MSTHAHSFTSDQKDQWRQRNDDFYRKLRPLHKNGKLTGCVVETAGSTGPLSFGHMADQLRSPKDFVLVEIRPATWIKTAKTLCRSYTDPAARPRLEKGEAVSVALRMLRSGEAVAALTLDVCDMVGSQTWWTSYGSILKDTALRSIEALGAFALILNHTLDLPPNKTFDPASERLKKHVLYLCQTFKGWGATPERFLGKRPSEQAAVADERSFVGRLGSFEIYLGEGRKFRMATVRMMLEPGRMMIDQEPRR